MNNPLSYIENYFFEYDRNAKLNPSLKKIIMKLTFML